MQDEGGAKGLSPVLERHWEKIVLAVVAVAFLVFLGAKFSGGGNTAEKALREAKALVAKSKGTDNPSLERPKSIPQVETSSPPMAVAAPGGVPGPKILYTPEFKRATVGPRATYFFPKVTLSSPTADFGGVEMEWSYSGTPDPEAKPKPLEVKPTTYFFQVERRKKGEQGWTILQKELKPGDLKSGSTTFRDERTDPKTEYEYRVILGSNDTAYERANNSSRLTEKVGGPAYVTTPGMWKVEFNNIMPPDPDAEPPKPGTAFVKITKYDPKAGEVSWSKIHKEGQALGLDDAGNSVHGVFSPKLGKTVQVDFKMGGKVSKIVTEKVIPHKIKVCTPKIGKDGEWTCPGPVETSAPYRVNEITFTDEDGKTQTDQRVSGTAPAGDQLCEDHGGAPVVRGPSPEEKSARAAKLLEEADTLWNTNERKKAQEKYKLLLATYGDTEVVKPRKNEIADRSTAKLN